MYSKGGTLAKIKSPIPFVVTVRSKHPSTERKVTSVGPIGFRHKPPPTFPEIVLDSRLSKTTFAIGSEIFTIS